MKYVVTIIQDESVCASFLFGSKREAMAKYHHEMEYAYAADNTTMSSVMDSNGRLIASEKYTAPAPVPVPEAEGGESE